MFRLFHTSLPFALLLLFPVTPESGMDEELFFDSGGVPIHYIDEGEGEVVVLLHGLCGTIELNWGRTGVIEDLAEDYRVIAIDLRAHGRSGVPAHGLGYGLDLAKDVIRLMDALEVERAHVISYSYGGTVAMKLLATWPERFRSMVLGETSWARDGDDEVIGFYEELADNLAGGKGVGPLIRSLTPEGEQPPSDREIAAIDEEFAAMFDLQALARLLRGTRELVVSADALQRNEVPCLALFGERSGPAAKAVIELEEVMGGLEFFEVEGGTHFTVIVRPEFLRECREFLTRCRD